YKHITIKQLKNSLRVLKCSTTLNSCADEVIYVSRLIRSTLTNRTKEKISKTNTVQRDLYTKFWTTCHKIFNTAAKVIPLFNLHECYLYFKDTLSQAAKNKRFTLPVTNAFQC